MKHLKYIYALLTFGLFTISGYAQDLTSVFLAIPDSILFGIDAEGKDKLIANPSDTLSVEVASSLNGKVKRMQISDDFIELQTSDAGTLQIKLLPLVNHSKIVCVVITACGKACDSYVQFYTTNWVPLTNSKVLFSKPDTNWYIKSDADSNEGFKNAYAAIDMVPVEIKLNAQDTSLSLVCNLDKYLSTEDYSRLQPYLIGSPKVYHWDNVSYK